MSLSDKKWDNMDIYSGDNVKEFIKDLKEEILKSNNTIQFIRNDGKGVFDLIDKLAGEDLI